MNNNCRAAISPCNISMSKSAIPVTSRKPAGNQEEISRRLRFFLFKFHLRFCASLKKNMSPLIVNHSLSDRPTLHSSGYDLKIARSVRQCRKRSGVPGNTSDATNQHPSQGLVYQQCKPIYDSFRWLDWMMYHVRLVRTRKCEETGASVQSLQPSWVKCQLCVPL